MLNLNDHVQNARTVKNFVHFVLLTRITVNAIVCTANLDPTMHPVIVGPLTKRVTCPFY